MKGYVYMIDYEGDQTECDSVYDLLAQLKYLQQDNIIIQNVKLVKDNDRYIERNISKRLVKKVNEVLGYEPKFILCNN